jgi:hypothetical protein
MNQTNLNKSGNFYGGNQAISVSDSNGNFSGRRGENANFPVDVDAISFPNRTNNLLNENRFNDLFLKKKDPETMTFNKPIT